MTVREGETIHIWMDSGVGHTIATHPAESGYYKAVVVAVFPASGRALVRVGPYATRPHNDALHGDGYVCPDMVVNRMIVTEQSIFSDWHHSHECRPGQVHR